MLQFYGCFNTVMQLRIMLSYCIVFRYKVKVADTVFLLGGCAAQLLQPETDLTVQIRNMGTLILFQVRHMVFMYVMGKIMQSLTLLFENYAGRKKIF